MKTNLKAARGNQHAEVGIRKPEISKLEGFALIIVLGLLVIILGLAVTFLNRTTIERGASASYAANAATRQFADTAVNLVEGQIHRASALGVNVAWASQPGMIRTFGAGAAGSYTASTNALLNFKLYSAPDMVTSVTNFAGDIPPADWADKTKNAGLWTDLNAPVRKIYPILAPQPVTGGAEQFSITNAPGATTNQPAPMPVRWLYLLQGGEIVAPGGSGNAITVAGDSKTNPIVGRIAFWTDDETCKVNINTASDGTFWDTPRAYSDEEKALAQYQPAQKEFQRYPGHPAMTSLKAVFPSLTSDQIYNIIPRVVGGGSVGGTVKLTQLDNKPLTPDPDRLYASVDELIFQPARGTSTNPLTQDQLEDARFFLTASSRAPEVTLFNTPRVAMWPIYKLPSGRIPDPNYTTAFDRLIAFCSTIDGDPYFFQRSDAYSSVNDISLTRNVNLLSYLTSLTGQAIPGFGGSFSAKYGKDRDQILTEIFDYIRSVNLQDSTLPIIANRFTKPLSVTETYAHGNMPAGYGLVVPSQRSVGINETMGFGRTQTLSALNLVFICNADGRGFLINGNKPTLAQCGGMQPVKDSNDAKIDSNNATTNKVLGGTRLKGEPFLDVGCTKGGVTVGAGNNVFDWDDTVSIAGYPMWKNNGQCDFEPWFDTNGNGQRDLVGEDDYWDANGNGQYDGEPHEPIHDWGRTATSQPAWDPTSWPAKVVPPANVIQWPTAGKNADTESNGVYDPGQKYIQAMVFPELFSVMQGLIAMGPDMQMTIEGLENFKINGQQIFPVISESAQFVPIFNHFDISRLGGFTNYRYFGMAGTSQLGRGSPARGNLPADTLATRAAPLPPLPLYPFIGTPIIIDTPATGGTMEFKGGTVTVKLYAGSLGAPVSANLIQTISIAFPAGPTEFPIPEIVSTAATGTGGEVLTNYPHNWWAFSRAGCINPNVAYTRTSKSPSVFDAGTVGRMRMLWHLTHSAADPSVASAGVWIRKEFDTVRSMVLEHGDYRLVAANPDVPDTAFVPHPLFKETSQRVAATLSGNNRAAYPSTGSDKTGKYIAGATYQANISPVIPSSATGVNSPEGTGDFDNGISGVIDGPYVNKADEGDAGTVSLAGIGIVPYFTITGDDNAFAGVGETFFSPNRQIPSSGMLGSLSTGVKAGVPWKTLLFRPQTTHPGYSTTIPDHLWTDLFWMPVVEPYAISEPFSTAGKINMNYQIMPFDYIRRATGLAALLRSEKIMAIPTTKGPTYKTGAGATLFRQPIGVTETLSQFDNRFTAGDIFRSASQICELYLVPTGQTVAGMPSFWNDNKLTGDNSRERPYTNLLGRLTTKSNTYTVHYRVQSLKKSPVTAAGQWNESRDKITGEFRGATTIERYINPNDTNIPDYGSSTTPLTEQPLSDFYKWRVVNTRTFAP